MDTLVCAVVGVVFGVCAEIGDGGRAAAYSASTAANRDGAGAGGVIMALFLGIVARGGAGQQQGLAKSRSAPPQASRRRKPIAFKAQFYGYGGVSSAMLKQEPPEIGRASCRERG